MNTLDYIIFVISVSICFLAILPLINPDLGFKIYDFISKPYKKLVSTFPLIPKFFFKLSVLCMFFVGIYCIYLGISDLFRVGEFGEIRTVRYFWGRPPIGDVLYEMRTFGSSFWDWFKITILTGVGLWISSFTGLIIYNNFED